MVAQRQAMRQPLLSSIYTLEDLKSIDNDHITLMSFLN